MRHAIVCVLLCACGGAPAPAAQAPATAPAAATAAAPASAAIPAAIEAAVNAPDRSADDRALDAGRKPAAMLAFFRIAPGQHVGELFAGGGYTTELLARTVGATGQVYAENTKEILDKFARGPWTARAAKPVMAHVTGLERPIDDPFPSDVHDLDAVIIVLNYHDTVWMGADRAKMNRAVFAALKPGGVYGIVDHSAKDGAGTSVAHTLHRIDEAVVKSEVTAAGFKLDGESDILRNPADARDWNPSPRAAGARRGTSDRFVLRFVKP